MTKDKEKNRDVQVEDKTELLQDMQEHTEEIEIEELPEENGPEEVQENLEENPTSNDEYNQLKDQFMRLQADFANFKRRSAAEKTEYIELGVKKIAMDVLPVLDNFERALESATEKNAFYDGIEMIMAQLKEALKKEGITEMEALGQPFDPNLHHAVLTAPSQEYAADYVIEVLQKGYLMNEKPLRPAMVKVSQ